jgi:hypothetical protein
MKAPDGSRPATSRGRTVARLPPHGKPHRLNPGVRQRAQEARDVLRRSRRPRATCVSCSDRARAPCARGAVSCDLQTPRRRGPPRRVVGSRRVGLVKRDSSRPGYCHRRRGLFDRWRRDDDGSTHNRNHGPELLGTRGHRPGDPRPPRLWHLDRVPSSRLADATLILSALRTRRRWCPAPRPSSRSPSRRYRRRDPPYRAPRLPPVA